MPLASRRHKRFSIVLQHRRFHDSAHNSAIATTGGERFITIRPGPTEATRRARASNEKR